MSPNIDSMLNENNMQISHVFLKSQIEYHKELTPFARRPLTSFIIDSSISFSGLRAGYAFILVNFGLLFISGLLLFRLSLLLRATHRQALLNMVVYFFSFSILFVFFPPIFSYDEPLQYCFIFAALNAYFRRKWPFYVLFFSLALIARETSILLLPALMLLFQRSKKFSKEGNFERVQWLMLLAPLVIYGMYIFLFLFYNDHLKETQIELGSRFSCFLENFESPKNITESILSVHFTLSFYLFLIFFRLKNVKSVLKNRFVQAFLLTVAINTPIVILTAFARESRLFSLPLLLLWPVFFQLFDKELTLFFSREFVQRIWSTSYRLMGFVVLMVINFIASFILYGKLGLGINSYFAEYLFLLNTFLLSYFLACNFKKNQIGPSG